MKFLPVKYTNQSNAWVTAEQFYEWFNHDFVPHVQEHLRSLGEEPKAILVLDNCSAHPDPKEFVSGDRKVKARFLPPNVTALIQPMDQGVIQSVKRRYKKKLLRRLIIEDDMGTSIVGFSKGVNLRIVVDLVHESWMEITKDTLRWSWQTTLPISPSPSKKSLPLPILSGLYNLAVQDAESADTSPQESRGSHGYGVWRGLRVQNSHTDEGQGSTTSTTSESVPTRDDDVHIEDFQPMFGELGIDIEPSNIVSWLESDSGNSGVQTYTLTMKFVSWSLNLRTILTLKIEMMGKKKTNNVQWLIHVVRQLKCLTGVWHGWSTNLRPQFTTHRFLENYILWQLERECSLSSKPSWTNIFVHVPSMYIVYVCLIIMWLANTDVIVYVHVYNTRTCCARIFGKRCCETVIAS